MTRDRIVRALVELLENDEIDQISMAALARSANVAERTIFRHFPKRTDLIAAAGEWISSKIFRLIPSSRPEDLSNGFRQACVQFDKHPRLAHAIAVSRVGRTARSEFRKQFIESSREVLEPLTEGLSQVERRRAEAVVTYLDNVLAWHTLREEFGMSGPEAADTIQWAMNLVFDHLHHTAQAANKTDKS